MRRIGVLGGTFDPIHNGHLAIARGAHQELGLERVLVVPARNPWLKGEQAITPAAHRLRMIELAIDGDERLALSTVDQVVSVREAVNKGLGDCGNCGRKGVVLTMVVKSIIGDGFWVCEECGRYLSKQTKEGRPT